jgi:CheY-like chemotaxis protein
MVLSGRLRVTDSKLYLGNFIVFQSSSKYRDPTNYYGNISEGIGEMTSKQKILVVDDDEQNRELIEAMLTPHGYDIIMAENGEVGVALAVRDKPSLILLDIMMPVIDGYVALSMMKNDPVISSIPVVMVTAIGYDLNKKLADKLGAAGYVTKPVTLSALLKEVGRCLPAL